MLTTRLFRSILSTILQKIIKIISLYSENQTLRVSLFFGKKIQNLNIAHADTYSSLWTLMECFFTCLHKEGSYTTFRTLPNASQIYFAITFWIWSSVITTAYQLSRHFVYVRENVAFTSRPPASDYQSLCAAKNTQLLRWSSWLKPRHCILSGRQDNQLEYNSTKLCVWYVLFQISRVTQLITSCLFNKPNARSEIW